MATPSPSALVVAILVPLIAWRIYKRFRRAYGRQRLGKYRSPIAMLLYAIVVTAITFANRHQPWNLAGFAAALLLGAIIARYALRLTTFEATPSVLYYTPHGPIGIAIASLFVLRLAYRLLEVFVLDHAVARSTAEFARSPLTLGALGLMVGYYACYTFGLLRWRGRVLCASRDAASPSGPAT